MSVAVFFQHDSATMLQEKSQNFTGACVKMKARFGDGVGTGHHMIVCPWSTFVFNDRSLTVFPIFSHFHPVKDIG